MKNKILFYLVLAGILFVSSCKKDFEEINKDPNGFTSASDGSLFNAIIASLQSGWNEQLYVNNEVIYKETQQVSLSQVRWNNYTIGTEEIWSNYYRSLPNFRELEKRFSALDTSRAAVKNMMAIVKVARAYKTFKVTDLFGDIPFLNAGYGFQDASLLHPSFDSQENIYKSLLNDLQWADQNIDAANNEEPFATFSRFDNLFFGSLSQWQKLANSLRLRYAMRMVNREPALAGTIIRDVIENARPAFGINEFGQLAYDTSQCAALWPYRCNYRNESKGWSFDQSQDIRMGTTMWHLLAAHDSTDGSGIFDPRAYYFFETNNNNKWVPYPNDPTPGMQPDGGSPYNYQRDFAFSAKGSNCLYSPANYYLVRDMDYIPDIIITGAEVLFLRAEAYLRGIGVAHDPGLATNSFLDGIQFSLSFWQEVMSQSKLPNSGTGFSANITVPSNLNFISVQNNNLDFFTASEADQLKIIYEQCFIDLFWQPQQAFALSRRTGLTPREGAASQVYRFPIPPSEVSYNAANWLNAFGSSGDNMDVRVWWMN